VIDMTIEAKQVYEWVKTGHWSLREFKDWLAEAEKQEPVAWMRTSGTGSPVVTEALLVEMPEMRWNFQQPLYTHSQPKQEQGEPVAWESVLGAVARGWCYEENANKTMDSELAVAIAKEVYALYTTPQQRKPLTDDEIWKNDDIMAANSRYGANFETLREVVRAVEVSHGIKENT
jgi:hypothetical protein